MNILAFIPYYPPHMGGLEKYSQELHEKLAEHGVHTTIVTTHIPNTAPAIENQKNIRIVRIPATEIIYNYPLPKLWLPSTWKKLYALRAHYDIVISVTRFFITTPLALLYAKATGTRWLHIEHGSNYVTTNNKIVLYTARVWDETIGRIVFRLADIIVAPSQSAKQFVQKFTSKKVEVIYRGINPQDIDKTPPINLSEAYNLTEHTRVITYAGRFIHGKGLLDLLEAIAQLHTTNIRLLLIGSGTLHATLRKKVEEKNLQSQVIFTGPKSFRETIGIMKASDIIVNPSHNEGLPTVILEAAIAARPIAATNVGGTKEIVTHNTSAILFPPRDVQKMTRALDRLLQNTNLGEQLGRKARQEVIRKFNWETALRKYYALFTAHD